jgi:hypothetical protein
MPVIHNPRGTPLPPDHPFATPQIVFGPRLPNSLPKNSTEAKDLGPASVPTEKPLNMVDPE